MLFWILVTRALAADADTDRDGVLDAHEAVGDTDGDGRDDLMDPDDDGDGVSTLAEGVRDADLDGTSAHLDADEADPLATCVDHGFLDGVHSFCRELQMAFDARAECQSRGLDLAVVASEAEDDWMLTVAGGLGDPNGEWWINAYFDDVDARWEDFDGVPLVYFGGADSDGSSGDPCARARVDSMDWGDLNCDETLYYVCAGDDDDHDGVGADLDCDDLSELAYPGAPEVPNGLDDDCDGALPQDDTDGDGLTDEEEGGMGLDWTDADTDGDGVSDGDEVAAGADPADPSDGGVGDGGGGGGGGGGGTTDPTDPNDPTSGADDDGGGAGGAGDQASGGCACDSSTGAAGLMPWLPLLASSALLRRRRPTLRPTGA